MTDQTTAAPYDAGDAAPAVSYRLPTGDEREQLRAEVRRLTAKVEHLRAELERVTAGRDYAVDLHAAASRELRELRRDLARIAGERNEARDERDAARQLVGELQAALVHVADRLHEIERYARRQADAEPASAPGSPRRAEEPQLPAWVYQLVAGLARYNAAHPPLYGRYAGRSGYERADCPCGLLDLVPREVREAALRHADAPSTPAATDGQGERQASAQEALQRAVAALGEIMAMPWETGEYAVRCACWVPESTVQRWREIHAAAMDALAGEGRDG